MNMDDVRSSITRKLGIENVRQTAPSHYVDSVVSVMLDAVGHYGQPLTKEKICAWQAAFFPSGYSDGSHIEVGRYRTNDWFNGTENVSYVIRSAIAHFWFVSIHPFEDGNGRLARILSDMMLARGDRSEFRFYNISSMINNDKKHYYDILEKTQHGDGDITEWILWYANTLSVALDEAGSMVSTVLNKSLFWQKASSVALSQRQTDMLNLFLDGYEAKITTKTWASLAKCSADTALRDIHDLVGKGVLREDIPGAKRPSYSIIYEPDDLTALFSEVRVEDENGRFYLKALYKGKTPVCERVLPLDAERFGRGDLPLENLLAKYCTYLKMN